MLIYFAASTTGIEKYEKNYKMILKTLDGLDIEVIENWFIAKLRGKSIYKNLNEAVKSEIRKMAQSDYVIAEVAVPSFAVAAAINQAVNQRKAVLSLYPEDLDKRDLSEVLMSNYYGNLKIAFYNTKNIKAVIQENLGMMENRTLSKFNFLISPEVASYLDWATKDADISKSEFLREEIFDKIIKQDQEYQKHQQGKRKLLSSITKSH